MRAVYSEACNECDECLVLAHHGIKGQRWGVRNGPPYPLENKSSSSSKTAGGAGAMLAFYAVSLAAYAGLVALANKAADARRTEQFNEEYYKKRDIKTLSEAPRVDPSSMSMEEHMKSVNPDYPEPGATENCMFCTTAMAMRMKGYDVSAEKCPVGWSSNNLQSTFKDYKLEKPKAKTTEQLEDYLKAQGDGAYGNLMVFWSMGGGHSMFYQVDKGKVKVYDTQANKMRKVRDLKGKIMISSTQVIRLDDKEPTEMSLGCVKRKGG